MAEAAVQVLSVAFYARDTVEVARALLGCILVTDVGGEVTAGRITEVEAYVGPHDAAAHSFGNRCTKRNSAMFGPAGTCYVYFTYGMHWCFNVVTEREGYPAAVLVRSLEPLSGLEVMARRRGNSRALCSGPARLCQAMGIDGAMNGSSIVNGPVRILRRPQVNAEDVVCGPRIGISRAVDWPLRFCLKGSRWLSRAEPKS